MTTVDADRIIERINALGVALARLGEDFDDRQGLRGVEGEALLLVTQEHMWSYGRSHLTPGRLSALLRLPSASTTSVLDRLERAGHVERVRDPRDRRRVLLRPTTAAVEAHTRHWQGLDARLRTVLTEFTGQELATVLRFLDRTSEVATEARQPDDGRDGPETG